MNSNDLLDYAIGQLEGPARVAFERELAADPDAAETSRRLGRSLNDLLDDGEVYEPPHGLADRTTLFVSEAARRKRSVLDFVPVAVPFRWADVAVAAGIFAAGLLTLLPAVQRSREAVAQAGCTYNLQQLGRALWLYGSQNHHYPFVPEKDPKASTGTFVALLHDSGVLSDLGTLDCPSNGSCPKHRTLPDFQSLCQLQASDPKACRDLLCWDYAYNVGFKHPETGLVHPIKAIHSAVIPILADAPAHENFLPTREGNSMNHGGRGQNVLFTDLHVGWHNTRRLGPHDDDMFLNDHDEPAPGLRPNDAVLLPSHVPFLGW